MAKVLVFSNRKGGVGKSTICFNVMGSLMQKGHTVAALDLDPQQTLVGYSRFWDFDYIDRPKVLADLKAAPLDYILVDTPPYLTTDLKELYTVADLVVIPTRPSIADLDSMLATSNLVQEVGAKAVIVINATRYNERFHVQEFAKLAEQQTALPVTNVQVQHRLIYQRGPLDGTVFQGDDDKAQKEIEDLTNVIIRWAEKR